MRRLSLRGLVALGVAVLLAVVRVPGADCNHNGIDDAVDIFYPHHNASGHAALTCTSHG